MNETIEQVAPGVWAGIPGPGEGIMAALVDSGSMLILDTTSYNVYAEQFAAEVARRESCAGPTLLYISHRHFDHFAGADAIDAPVIGHWLTRQMMARYTPEWMTRNIAEWTELDMVVPELLRDPQVVLPQILFDSRLELMIGEAPVELIHVGGHCADQTVAFMPSQRVLFASDNIIRGKPAYTGDGDLLTWIEALKKMRALGPEVVIPGHGDVGGPELIDEMTADLEQMLADKLGGPTT